MRFFSVRALFCAATLIFAIFSVSTVAFAEDAAVWRPVTPAELEMKVPAVDPTADAEAIFWDITLDDKKSDRLIYRHYVRVKIFTERGREKFAKMDIPFMKGKKVEGVAARVIKPDGSIVVLQPSEIFEREIVRVNKVRVQAKSFAVPGIEPGVIVEYQYTESIKNDSAGGERLTLQRDIPMQNVTYHIRPVKGATLHVRSYNMPVDMPSLNFADERDNKGFQVATMVNVPAIKEEPNMPPEDEVRRWAYLSYSGSNWTSLSYFYGLLLSQFAKESKEIKNMSLQITAGAATPDEKLRRIYEFVQGNIKNVSFDRSLTDEQREKLNLKNASDVLEKRVGNEMLVDLLFAAMANAAGFETGIFLTADRGEYFFSPEKYPYTGFVRPSGIAVIVGYSWKFFEPGVPYLPYGSLAWNDEGASALVIGANSYMWKQVPLADHTKSIAKRTGRFKLLEDGTLQGRVTVEYDGHQATRRRRDGFMSSPEKREENLRDEAKENAKNGEITAVSIENFENPAKSLTYSYEVRVPNYAQKTGKRLFLQPGFFEYGSAAVFAAAARTHPIYFSYPWSENDDVEIELPKGFTVDSGDSSNIVNDPSKIGSLRIQIAHDPAAGVLKYKRDFYFGANNNILFPANKYEPIRQLFDAFHKADTQSITLRQAQ